MKSINALLRFMMAIVAMLTVGELRGDEPLKISDIPDQYGSVRGVQVSGSRGGDYYLAVIDGTAVVRVYTVDISVGTFMVEVPGSSGSYTLRYGRENDQDHAVYKDTTITVRVSEQDNPDLPPDIWPRYTPLVISPLPTRCDSTAVVTVKGGRVGHYSLTPTVNPDKSCSNGRVQVAVKDAVAGTFNVKVLASSGSYSLRYCREGNANYRSICRTATVEIK